jgi:GTP-binding protein Era
MNIEQKFGFVAILGEPNAGKSTFINRVVQNKISAVSPKVQTTRQKVLGIYLQDLSQVVFIDTPGIFKAKKSLEKRIVNNALSAIPDADIYLVLIDAKHHTQESLNIISKIAKHSKPIFIVLNKIDLLDKNRLLELARDLSNQIKEFHHIFMVSALSGDGVDDVLKSIQKYIPQGPWLYPHDEYTTLPLRSWAAEITREKLYFFLREELPYQTFVETEKWESFRNGSVKIMQSIVVARESQKSILLGKKGEMIKKIGQAARQYIEKELQKRVHLFLFVKIKEDWMENEFILKEQGLM